MSAMLSVEDYVGRLHAALAPLPAADRERLTLEIRSHLSEVEARGAGAFERTLKALGPPESFARGFLDDYDLAEAVEHGSLKRVLVGLLKVSARSVAALVTAFGAFTAYAMGVGFTLVAVLKPVFPAHTGLWLHPLKMGLELGGAPERGPELLGWWIIPVALALAVGCMVAGTVIARVGAKMVVGRRRK